jgi:hypothetical protein
MHLQLEMLRQPNDTSCGPTCLHAIYRFFGQEHPLNQIIEEIPKFEDGGTISVHLASHAQRRGFQSTLYSYNLRIFDPTWWNLSSSQLIDKLQSRIRYLESEKLIHAHLAYIAYLELGGRLKFRDLTPALLQRLLDKGAPILIGLSATYLYQSVRELPNCEDDDIAGQPVGHFVVATGFSEDSHEVIVTDPFEKNPFNPLGEYRVDVHRFINSIMLGIITYDANLLIITPPHIGR